MKLYDYIGGSEKDLDREGMAEVFAAMMPTYRYVTQAIPVEEFAAFTSRLRGILSIVENLTEEPPSPHFYAVVLVDLMVEHIQSNAELVLQLLKAPVTNIPEEPNERME